MGDCIDSLTDPSATIVSCDNASAKFKVVATSTTKESCVTTPGGDYFNAATCYNDLSAGIPVEESVNDAKAGDCVTADESDPSHPAVRKADCSTSGALRVEGSLPGVSNVPVIAIPTIDVSNPGPAPTLEETRTQYIIDQCVAQGVPFAREYGGLLDNRSFGGVQVSRTFYARGQTGQQLLIGAYQALERQVAAGTVKEYARHEMVELIVDDGKARGIVARDMSTGELQTFIADAVVLATGGYGNVFFLSTNAMGCNGTAIWRAYRKGAYFGNPCFTQIHPTCIPQHGDQQSKLTLMSESLRNDGRIWVPKRAEDCEKDPRDIPEEDRDYYLERIYPSFGNLVPRDIASRQAKNMCDEGRGVGPKIDGVARGVYLDFSEAISRMGRPAVSAKYGNLFDMYERITGDNPYEVPMRIYPAVHYTMGGLWVDYDLESNLPGLYVAGEANFSDHGANRLGASALMQGLSDGYFVLPNTINDYLAHCFHLPTLDENSPSVKEALDAAQGRIDTLMSINGTRSVDSFHKELGKIMWEYCGMERTEEGLKKAIGMIRELRADYWKNVRVPGKSIGELNQSLEKAGRVADFMELGELMCIDALHREESCGGHFRAESQTPEGEALRHDDKFLYVAAWEFAGDGEPPILHKEDLIYNDIELKQRSYK